MWNLSFMAVLELIWKEGNARCFEGKTSRLEEVIDKIKFKVAAWASILACFHDYSIKLILQNLSEVAFS